MKKSLLFILLVFISQVNAQIITTVAGTGNGGYSGDGVLATSSNVSTPFGVSTDAYGNIYIADYSNQRIRKVSASSGIINTIAGNGTQGYSGDGAAAINAEMDSPFDVCVDTFGNVYFSDRYNNRVRKVNAFTGIISTIAGNGTAGYSGDGAAATNAQLNDPTGVFVDDSGNVFIADDINNRIRKVNAITGIITTIAGNGIGGYSGDGGPATNAQLASPTGVSLDDSGNVYIADGYNNRIRKVNASTGIITTIAGDGTMGFSGDGWDAVYAQLNNPLGVSVDAAGNVYIADTFNNSIRKITASTGIISTLAGGIYGYSGDGGPAANGQFAYPFGVFVDISGNVYVADRDNNRIRMISNASTAHTNYVSVPNSQLSIYPNPVSSIGTIQSSTELGIISVYNSLGELVLQTKTKNKQEQINLSKVSSGIYTVHAQDRYLKLVKE